MKKILAAAVIGVAFVIGVLFFILPSTPSIESTSSLEMPKVSKATLQALLERQASDYEAQGFRMTPLSDGYELEAVSEEKVRHFLIEKMDTLLPASMAPLLGDLKETLLHDQEVLLKGLRLKMEIIQTSQSAKLEVTLTALPHSVTASLANNPEEARIVKALLEKGALAYILWLDDQGTLRGIELKNIQETWEQDHQKIAVTTKNIWTKFQGALEGTMQMQQAVEAFVIGSTSAEESFKLALHDLSGSASQTDPLNGRSTLDIKSVEFFAQDQEQTVKIALKNIASHFESSLKEGFVQSRARYLIDTIHVQTNQGSASIEGMAFSIVGAHIHHEAMLMLQQAQAEPEKWDRAVETLLQKGLEVQLETFDFKKLSIAMQAVDPDIDVKNFKFNVHFKLKENQLALNQQNLAMYIPYTAVEGRLELDNADLDKLIVFNPMLGMLSMVKKAEGTQAIFEFAFKEGKITLNGNPLPF